MNGYKTCIPPLPEEPLGAAIRHVCLVAEREDVSGGLPVAISHFPRCLIVAGLLLTQTACEGGASVPLLTIPEATLPAAAITDL